MINIEQEIKFIVDPQQAESIKEEVRSGAFGIASESQLFRIVDTYFVTDEDKRLRIRQEIWPEAQTCSVEVKLINSIENGLKKACEISAGVQNPHEIKQVLLALGYQERNVVEKLRKIYFTDSLQISFDYIQGQTNVHVEYEMISGGNTNREKKDELFQSIRDFMAKF